MNSTDHSPLFPSSHASLVYYGGLTHEQAFDELAERAAQPEVQAEIRAMQATPHGRSILRDLRTYWDAEGLPCPWDVYLDVGT